MNAMRLGGGPVAGPDVLTAKSPVPILIVDDSSSKRLGLKAILAPLGYLIVEAESGTAALRCVLAQEFAVILLDVCMPTMDGFETAALIRQRHQSEMTPIIFITAFKSDELRNTDLYAEGAVDFIFAPVPPDELRAKVSVFAKLFLRAEELASKARDVQASADQLRLLTDAAPIGIFQTDNQNRYVYTNPRWTEITGIRPDDVAGLEWDTIMGSQERAAFDAASADGDVHGDELCHRFEIRTTGAPARIVLLTSKCIRDQDGGVVGWVGTLADITAEVGAESAMADARDDATEASRLKSDFLANMSHEIRTPMNGVIGMTDLLLETDLDPRQREYAQTVRNSGEALLTIINDILDFSKVEAGKVEIEEVEFNLRAVVDDVVDLLANQAQAKGLALVAVIEHAVPAVVSGDPGRVRQVLTNLVGNAIKFTSAGEVVVRAAVVEAAGAETIVRFEVSDTGDGIAPDKVDLVFRPFVQADTSTSRRYGGTGLGLAISSHLVSLMGGQCGLSSRLGEGSTFWFTIRVHAEAGQETPWSPAAVSTHRPSDSAGGTGRLLLAEDNLINQNVAEAMLLSGGYQVDMVLNGAAAVQASAAQVYDAILMDCQMPELSGYEATAAIRAREGTGRHTPIIALTAGARREDRERCLAEGMDAYLSKPLNKDALLALVARFVPRGHSDSCGDVLNAGIVDGLKRLGESEGEDLFGNLAIRFLTDAAAAITALRRALDVGDAAAVVRSAHALSGASANLGATELARLCAVLETGGAVGHQVDGGALVDAVETELGRVRDALGARNGQR